MRRVLAFLLVGTAALCAATEALAQKGPKFQAAAVEVKFVDSTESRLPPEFQVALYENLFEEMQKTGKFEQVFREGDQAARREKSLLTLSSTVRLFQKGSAMARQVTTVSGATKITVRVQLATRDGRLMIDRDVEGKVQFFGENLRATQDFAKDVAKLIRKNF